MKTIEFTLPDIWAAPLVNDDWTGIEDVEEEKCIMQFLQDNPGLVCVDVKEDSAFESHHDAADYGVLPSDCSTFVFH